MNISGLLKLALILFLALLLIYVGAIILEGIYKSLNEIPLWIGFLIPILAVIAYNTLKHKE